MRIQDFPPNPFRSGGPFSLTVEGSGNIAPVSVVAGENDLRQWFAEPQPRLLNISSSRWGHELLVRHPNGDAYAVLPAGIVGDTSYGPEGHVWQNSYYYFEAAANHRPELPWYVEDAGTGERIGPNPDDDQLIMWINVTAPHGLTAQALSYTAILLNWQDGDTDTEGGFRIERRVRVGRGRPFSAWKAIATVGGAATSYVDRLGAGSLAIYRVRAFFGPRSSAPSNPAIAATWIDLDGNGQPDPQPPPPGIVNNGNGVNPVVDPPGGGGDGGGDGGVPGDGDGDPDNDKDGVVDIHDRYPNDPRRSEDIPVKF